MALYSNMMTLYSNTIAVHFRTLVYVSVALGFVYILYSQVMAYLTERKFIRLHGCAPINGRYRTTWRGLFVGFDFMAENFRAAAAHDYLENSRSRFERLGKTWRMRIMGKNMIQSIEPENLKAVFSTNCSDWWLGPARADSFRPLLGNGIFTLDGGAWRHSRDMLRPAFVKSQVSNLGVYERHIQRLLTAFLPRDGVTPVDLQPLFFKLTMDSATEILFGKSVDSLRPDHELDDTARGFGGAYEKVKWEVFKNITLYPFGKLRFWSGMQPAIRTVHSYVDNVIAEAEQREKKEHFERLQSPGRMEEKPAYCFLREMAHSTTDKRKIRSELLSVLLAGRDTTAALLSNIFFILARRPDILVKLHAEISFLNGQPPSYVQLKELGYVHAVMKESLRIHPVVPVNTRTALRPTVLPTGGGPSGDAPVYVPAGTQFVTSIYALHRCAAIWGTDGDSFRPERWFRGALAAASPDRSASPTRMPRVWEYMPFLGGQRVCPGQGMSMTEAAYTIVRLLQMFPQVRALPGEEGDEWTEELAVTCSNNTERGARVLLTPA